MAYSTYPPMAPSSGMSPGYAPPAPAQDEAPNPLLSLLGYIGESMDKPGRAVRGLLAGKPEEGLAAIPFSDTLGLTDPANRVSGRALLEKLGVVSPKGEDAGFDLGDVAGMGTELALDPINLLGGAAVGKALGRSKILAAIKDYKAPQGFPAEYIKAATGRAATPMTLEEAAAHYAPWQKSLSPEEAKAFRMWSGNDNDTINHVLRGQSFTSGGHPYDPFEYRGPLSELQTPELARTKAIEPIDAALARGQTPRDAVVFRRHGRLVPEGDLKVGQEFSDPGYLGTSVDPTPERSFYGRNVYPRDVHFSMVLPEGSKGGYLGGAPHLAPNTESELLLPHDSRFRVAGERDVPIGEIRRRGGSSNSSEWYRLDAEGKPIRSPNQIGGALYPPWVHGTDEWNRVYEMLPTTQKEYLLELLDPNEGRLQKLMRQPPGPNALLAALGGYNLANRGTNAASEELR